MPPLRGHSAGTAGERVKSRRAHGDDQLWFEQPQFRSQPPRAALHFPAVGARMEPPFASLFKLEMLDGVGDITLRAIEVRFLQARIEQPAGGADKWMALQVFFIAGLFADKHDTRIVSALAKNQLGGILVKIATFAAFGLPVQCSE